MLVTFQYFEALSKSKSLPKKYAESIHHQIPHVHQIVISNF